MLTLKVSQQSHAPDVSTVAQTHTKILQTTNQIKTNRPNLETRKKKRKKPTTKQESKRRDKISYIRAISEMNLCGAKTAPARTDKTDSAIFAGKAQRTMDLHGWSRGNMMLMNFHIS